MATTMDLMQLFGNQPSSAALNWEQVRSRRDSIRTQFGQDAVESLLPGGPSERNSRPEWTKWTQ